MMDIIPTHQCLNAIIAIVITIAVTIVVIIININVIATSVISNE